jgi:hypothetical protein
MDERDWQDMSSSLVELQVNMDEMQVKIQVSLDKLQVNVDKLQVTVDNCIELLHLSTLEKILTLAPSVHNGPLMAINSQITIQTQWIFPLHGARNKPIPGLPKNVQHLCRMCKYRLALFTNICANILTSCHNLSEDSPCY